MGRKVYDINFGFRAVPLEQEVLLRSKEVQGVFFNEPKSKR